MKAAALLTSIVLLACGAGMATVTARAGDDFQERDEVNRTFQLAPGTHVEVSSIRGPVEIVTTESSTAEVQIVRTARTRADLDHHKIEVEQSGNSLVVKGIQETEKWRRQNIQVNHHVILKLPRQVNVTLNSISGSVNVGDVDGQIVVNSVSGSGRIRNVSGKVEVNSVSGDVDIGNVGADTRVNSVSGNVRLGQVNGAIEVLSLTGGLNATVTNLSAQGIRIVSVTGSIEIGFRSDVNADFKADSINGHVYLDLPNVTRDRPENAANVHARIGAGGTPISIVSVTGNVRLARSAPRAL